jgi:hypothetical protein
LRWVYSSLCRDKTDLGMCAITEWLIGGGTTATQSDLRSIGWIWLTLAIGKDNIPSYQEGTIIEGGNFCGFRHRDLLSKFSY